MHSNAVLNAYRHIYRASLQAVQYSSPARHTLRTLINTEFRLNKAKDFDTEKVNNTVNFLKHAAKATGLEHRMVKNLLHVWFYWMSPPPVSQKVAKSTELEIRRSTLDHMKVTLKMLNQSMNMCLPVDPARKLDSLYYLR